MGQHDDVKRAYCMLMRRGGLKRKSFMTAKKYYMGNKKVRGLLRKSLRENLKRDKHELYYRKVKIKTRG
jgi:hypothetical protein